jgi:hypothetical protein
MIDTEASGGHLEAWRTCPQGFTRSRLHEESRRRTKKEVLFTEQVVKSDHGVRTAG